MSKRKSLRRFIKEHRNIHRWSKTIAILLGVFYYMSTGLLSFHITSVYKQRVLMDSIESLVVPERLFLWKSVVSFEIPPFIHLNVSPMNLILMVVFMVLIYKNMLLFLISINYPRISDFARRKGNLIALLPTIFAGISFVLMSLIMSIGISNGSLLDAILMVYAVVIPVSFVLLIYRIYEGYDALHLHYPG